MATGIVEYRYKVTSNRTSNILGTGTMTSSKKLNDVEQMQLFHNMTHNLYLNNSEMVRVDIQKVTNP